MCGIYGVFGDGGLSPADASAAVEALRPRGPDGTGVWASPSGRAVLGHTRLAVVDPVGSAQPIADGAGEAVIVVNGEFYDHRRVRRDLARTGHPCRTGGDSEIALRLYLRDGHRALRELRGEFAFALWDERRGELFAARDRFGVKPLFYAERNGRLYLSSEIKALLACGVPARWDLAAYAAHLQAALPPDRTLFAGVRQLPPGCYLVAGGEGVAVHRYWDLDYPTTEELAETERGGADALAGHVALVRSALDEAVRLRTVADVPLASHLSGGVDSSAVAALAARHAPITGFTVQFPDSALDESPIAARTATRLDLPLRRVGVEPADTAAHLVATLRAGEMVQENSHGVARFLHSAAIRAGGFKVALAGEGGDELFAGYPQSQRDLALSLDAAALERARAGYRKLSAFGAPRHLRSTLDRLGFLPGWLTQRHLAVVVPSRPLLRREFADLLDGTDSCGPLLDQSRSQLDGRPPLHQSSYLFAKGRLANYLLAAERLDAAHAVEARLPYLDHHLFATARAAALSWYAPGGRAKHVLREAVRDELSDEVYAGGKRGFFAPPAAAGDGLVALLRGLVDDSAMRDNPIYEPAAVRRFLDELDDRPAERQADSDRLLHLVTATSLLTTEFGMTADTGPTLGGSRG
ncbi:asparagine synthase (glutamine-hydrolyzing) [Actinosynnema mirum]|uniref:asparagine synthase (glutamine-hydrolyzing) n=1 Tax=Actinosynnema mirum (strain ATCC 29888 / DSM 43827 / JCM 3225 / NBRC 14064 / NCIMB 13271 / NRRL B-12336 / IMRU 3971 / 101) TaxID=446462 RepID=C6WBZ3_ACTMD|nr:asparagine synthase (glutamine-hydrolyzing) [Actinosynnema mirum]ACU37560.1 asparagine synthase (glutamine-hydrolyzing) [Actinosynnema mirum DSM 43827]